MDWYGNVWPMHHNEACELIAALADVMEGTEKLCHPADVNLGF